MGRFLAGKPVRRYENARLLTGGGSFLDDCRRQHRSPMVALAAAGAADVDMPATPERIRRALSGARKENGLER